MVFRFIIFNLLLFNIHCEFQNEFIVKYFNYKKVSDVVGLFCYPLKEHLSLLKDFSKHDIKVVLNEMNNETQLLLLADTNNWKVGIFLNLQYCSLGVSSSILNQASESGMFDELHYWLVLSSDLAQTIRIINHNALDLVTDFMIAIFSNDTNDFTLYDVYSLSKEKDSSINIILFGTWSSLYGFSIVTEESKLRRRSNMNGIALKAMFFKSAYKKQNVRLEKYLEDFTNPSQDGNSKFGYQILSHFSDLYNFSLQCQESFEWTPGDPHGPLARALMNNTIDVTGTPFTMTVPRTYFLKYVHQDWPFRTCFIFRNPQKPNIKVQEILSPFESIIWYLMTIVFIFILVLFSVMLQYEKFNNGNIKYSNSFIITLGALCQQGTDMKMSHTSTRVVFLSCLIFSLLMFNYYSASIVSARLNEPILKINDSLNQLGKLQLQMASERMSYLEFFLKQTYWDTKIFYQNYWLTLPNTKLFEDAEVGMSLVKKGGFAYHTHPDVGYFFIEKTFDNREICELMEVHLARPIKTAFAVTHNSSYKEIARVGLTKIAEVGLQHRQLQRWSFKKPRCRKDILSSSSITIHEFAPLLILLMLGIFTSIIIGTIELITAHLRIFF